MQPEPDSQLNYLNSMSNFGIQDKFLECADAARADYLVTGNTRQFPKFWKKTRVITSREFMDIVAPHLIP